MQHITMQSADISDGVQSGNGARVSYTSDCRISIQGPLGNMGVYGPPFVPGCNWFQTFDIFALEAECTRVASSQQPGKPP